jgi:uncharacterized protein YbjQ (UPF0145 family)
MQALNEINFLTVSVLYFCFTDFNPDPLVKVYCGWVLILVVISNLIYPNFTSMVRDTGASISKKKEFISNKKKKGLKNMEKARKDMIAKHKMQLKAKFKEKCPENEEYTHPRIN